MKKILTVKMLKMRNGMFQNDSPNIALQKNETAVDVYTHRYINDSNDLHQLNIYAPKGINKKLPLLIDIHGGGWIYGDKDTNGLLCMDFAKRGFITMSMSYRLLPEYKLLDMIQDIFSSLHYLYSLKSQYLIDFNNVAIMGDSAGGHLNLICNAINNSSYLQECFGVEKLPFNIKCIVANHPAPFIHNPVKEKELDRAFKRICYGFNYTKTSFYPYVSIKGFGKFLDKNTKILIITSKDDNVVREQAFDCAKLLNKLNIPYDFYDELGNDTWHVYNVTQPFREISIKCNNYIEKFIKENL